MSLPIHSQEAHETGSGESSLDGTDGIVGMGPEGARDSVWEAQRQLEHAQTCARQESAEAEQETPELLKASEALESSLAKERIRVEEHLSEAIRLKREFLTMREEGLQEERNSKAEEAPLTVMDPTLYKAEVDPASLKWRKRGEGDHGAPDITVERVLVDELIDYRGAHCNEERKERLPEPIEVTQIIRKSGIKQAESVVFDVRARQDELREVERRIDLALKESRRLRELHPEASLAIALQRIEKAYAERVSKLSVGVPGSLNEENEQGFTGLMLAATSGCLAGIEILLERKADLDFESRKGHTALLCASKHAEEPAMKALLKAKASINYETADGRTALNQAALLGQVSSLRLLADRKADVGHDSRQGLTPLIEASLGEQAEAVKCLAELQVDLNQESRNAKTALLEAASHGKKAMVELLLQMKASVDQETAQGHTALGRAAWNGKTEAVDSLISGGANMNRQSRTGNTPSGMAAYNGHVGCLEVLSRNRADLELETDQGFKTPLMKAVQAGRIDAVTYLSEEAGVKLDQETRDGNTALILAAGSEGRSKAVKALCKAKASVDWETFAGKTALIHAVMVGQEDAAMELNRAKADMNRENRLGRTPLMSAVMCKQQKCVVLLLQLGADPGLVTSNGQSAEGCAKNMKNDQALHILRHPPAKLV